MRATLAVVVLVLGKTTLWDLCLFLERICRKSGMQNPKYQHPVTEIQWWWETKRFGFLLVCFCLMRLSMKKRKCGLSIFSFIAAAAAAKSLQLCPTDSVRPHRRQPTRLPHPWDSPGKNTWVGCHFFLQCMKVKVKSLSHVWLLATPWSAAYQAPPSMGFSRQE